MAQKKDSTYAGVVNGVVRDSVYNYNLQFSTVAIYKIKDSSLVSYRLADNFGEFHFKDLPIGISLKIVVSYVGYKTLTKKFSIPFTSRQVDFNSLNLYRRDENNLKEVTITASPPPVRMNGDTLEFNADAFALDKNAVAEDLLRKLPGITVWGDGTITFNGKQISRVLVEGKPFFGGDPTIATQNIAKEAIDKIQVYQQNADSRNRLDSITNLNIKLKKNKKYGHFGKLASGYGTDNHYEVDANLNYFNSKTQIGLVGAGNNINKTASDVNTLMRNSTFKGTGANIEYQPDFRTQGINQPNSGGFIFQHDFILNPHFNDNNRLTANYFINHNTRSINQNSQTITRLGGDSTQIQQSNSISQSNNTSQSFDARYEKQKNKYRFYISTIGNTNSEQNQSSNKSSSVAGLDLQSTNNTNTNSDNDSKSIGFETGLTRQGSMTGISSPFNYFDINYSINAGNSKNNRTTNTRFTSFADTSKNKFSDRAYTSSSDDTKQHIYMNLGNVLDGIIPYRSVFARISIKVQNNMDVNLHHEENNVKDKAPFSSNYLLNKYLTNNMETTVINERPALVFEKSIQQGLPDRYLKTLVINFNAEEQFLNQDNNSDQLLQNFNKTYQKFIPGASIKYVNNQFREFEDSYTVNFATAIDYPTVQQLHPLVDSLNQYFIQEGNPNLKPATNRILSFNFQHVSLRTKNTFKYDLNINATITNNSFADSILTDNTGRNTYYPINAVESKKLGLSGSLNKAFKFSDHQLQITFNADINFSKNPGYVNSTFTLSNNFFYTNRLNLYYTYSNRLAVDFTQGYSRYHSRQSGNSNSKFNNSALPTAFSASFNCTKRLSVNSNITYNHTTSTGVDATNFTIWNANATYRFMEGNNLEIKASALDLLHQNTNIINYGNNNSITHERTNALQQYFMITMSYFPRQFGKSKK
jgi:hypothetical protein